MTSFGRVRSAGHRLVFQPNALRRPVVTRVLHGGSGLLVPTKDFTPTKAAPKLDPLTTLLSLRIGLPEVERQGAHCSNEGLADFAPIQSKGHDEIIRTFKIWTARLGKGHGSNPSIHRFGSVCRSTGQQGSPQPWNTPVTLTLGTGPTFAYGLLFFYGVG